MIAIYCMKMKSRERGLLGIFISTACLSVRLLLGNVVHLNLRSCTRLEEESIMGWYSKHR